MKKLVSLILTAIMLITPCLLLTGCEFGNATTKTVYVATADFFYSADDGHSYGNGKKVYTVGETVYMQVIVKVTSNKETPEPISFRLTIPGVETVIAKYFDGQPVTPLSTTDGEIIYEFTIPANGPDEAGRFVFEFVPFKATPAEIVLKFDDKIDPMYDKQSTIRFVDKVQTDGE